MLVPFEFLKQRPSVSWGEALWAYERQLIEWTTLVDLAVQRLENGSDDELEIELAGVGKANTDEAGELLRKLARPTDPNAAKRKWLCFVLTWIFENRSAFDDPLDVVAIVYADFDYPKEVAAFVKYMPVTDGYDPSAHTYEQNIERLYESWRRFTEVCGANCDAGGSGA
jgi:hypothetical protein